MDPTITGAIIAVIGALAGATIANRTTRKVAEQQREHQARLRQCEPWAGLAEFVSQRRDDIANRDYKQIPLGSAQITIDAQDVTTSIRQKLKTAQYMMYDESAENYVKALYEDLDNPLYDSDKPQLPGVYDTKSYYLAVFRVTQERLDTLSRYTHDMLYKTESRAIPPAQMGLFT